MGPRANAGRGDRKGPKDLRRKQIRAPRKQKPKKLAPKLKKRSRKSAKWNRKSPPFDPKWNPFAWRSKKRGGSADDALVPEVGSEWIQVTPLRVRERIY